MVAYRARGRDEDLAVRHAASTAAQIANGPSCPEDPGDTPYRGTAGSVGAYSSNAADNAADRSPLCVTVIALRARRRAAAHARAAKPYGQAAALRCITAAAATRPSVMLREDSNPG